MSAVRNPTRQSGDDSRSSGVHCSRPYTSIHLKNRHPPKPKADDRPDSDGVGSVGVGKTLTRSLTKEELFAALLKTNADTFRLSNDGRFPAKVSLAFEKQAQVKQIEIRG